MDSDILALVTMIVTIVGAVWALSSSITNKMDELRTDMRGDVRRLSDLIASVAIGLAEVRPRIDSHERRLTDAERRLLETERAA